MKTKYLILMCSLLLLASTAFCEKQEEFKRTISKNFTVSKNSELLISNKYGNLVIAEWDKNEIDFQIEIIGKASDERRAKEMADRASVNFIQNGNKVSAETTFAQKDYPCRNCGTTVNYTVKVPSSIFLDLTNKYGNIVLNQTSQTFKADIKYGNLNANRLLGQNNIIQIKYGNLSIDEATILELDMEYSNATINKISDLTLECAYGNLQSNEIKTLKLSTKYSQFSITSLGQLTGSAAYDSFTIGNLQKTFDINLRYGKIRIDDVSVNFDNIRIDAAYTNIRIGIDDRHNFNAKLLTRYGKIRTGELKFTDVKFNDDDRYTKSVTGKCGSAAHPTATVEINNSYADIILEK